MAKTKTTFCPTEDITIALDYIDNGIVVNAHRKIISNKNNGILLTDSLRILQHAIGCIVSVCISV